MKIPAQDDGRTERIFELNELFQVQGKLHNFPRDSFLHDLYERLRNITMKQLLP